MTDPAQYLLWITSRAAGTTAMVLASISVGYGLAMAGRVLKGAGADRRNIHQTLSLAVMLAIAMLGPALLGDRFLHPTLLDVTVPFVFAYKTIPTSLGIVGGWALTFLGLSYYWRGRIGVRRWKAIHRFTLLAWLGALVHSFAEGTDSGQLWFVALILISAAPALALLVARLASRGPQLPAALAGR